MVVADARLKTHTAAESSEIVRQNCGRSSQSRHHPVGKQFALARQFFGDAIENQIKIDFAGNRNVKTWHRSLLCI